MLQAYTILSKMFTGQFFCEHTVQYKCTVYTVSQCRLLLLVHSVVFPAPLTFCCSACLQETEPGKGRIDEVVKTCARFSDSEYEFRERSRYTWCVKNI